MQEFGLGLYEGIGGIFTDPYKGAKKEGGLGFVKGLGRGIFSVPFRVMGGAFSVPAYAMKGLYQEAMKNKGANVQNYIIAARISQGYDEAQNVSRSERDDIISQWKCIKLNVKKKKNIGEGQLEALHTLMKEKRAKRQGLAKVDSQFQRPEARPTFPPQLHEQGSYDESLASTPAVSRTQSGTLTHANTFPRPHPAGSLNQQHQQHLAAEEEEAEAAERLELERAIQASVAETSRGDPNEDELIERAIRASVAELERPVLAEEDEEEAMQRALKASIEEASKHGASAEEQKMLEETLKASLMDKGGRTRNGHGSDSEWDSSDDTEEDEEYQRIIAESKELAHLHSQNPNEYLEHTATGAQESGIMVGRRAEEGEDDDDEAMRKVLEESARAEQVRMEGLEKQKTEEEIVLEYVKKQSLAEEEHRRRMAQGRDVGGSSSANP